jgi:hypothetical protein
MRKPWLPIVAVVLPPLALAALGLSHPSVLTAESAAWWTTLHLILLPLFPALGVCIWVLLREDKTAVGWGGRVAAVVYVAFYGGLDCISGIAAGTVVQAGADPASDEVHALFAAGRPLALIGAYAFFVAVILVLGSAWRRGTRGVAFAVLAVVLLASAYLFTTSHIYWPKGVATMIGFALGLGGVELLNRRRAARAN